jgi:hypothetical protein
MVWKVLKHQENIILAYFWLSRQPEFTAQNSTKNYFGLCIAL